MFTLSGCSGHGAVYGVFPIQRQKIGTKVLDANSILNADTPPSDWYLPKPDRFWYDVNATPYGPRLAHMKVGFLDGVENSPCSFNECKHSTIVGDGFWRGSEERLGVTWLRRSIDDTGYTACDDKSLPRPLGTHMVAYAGIPSTQGYPYGGSVLDRNGNSTDIWWWYSEEIESTCYQRRWMYPAVAPLFIRDTLTHDELNYAPGKWYCSSLSENPVRNFANNTTFSKALWTRPERTKWGYEEWMEFHSTASYTPADSIGDTGFGYTVESIHYETTIEVTHVMSSREGLFYVKCDYHTTVHSKGYLFPNYFDESCTFINRGVVSRLFVMGPGLVPEVDPIDWVRVEDSLDNYCKISYKAAMKLFTFEDFRYVNTKALLAREGLESNWIENLSSVGGPGEILAPLVEGNKALKAKDFNGARKALASAYLVYKYVVKPTASDVVDVRENLTDTINRVIASVLPRDRRRARLFDYDVPFADSFADLLYTTEYWHQVKDCKLSRIWNALEQLGLDPSLANGWDLVPYSFVIDWFTPIGDILDVVSGWFNNKITRDLIARINSNKAVWPLSDATLAALTRNCVGVCGSPLLGKAYHRLIAENYGPLEFLGQSFNFDGLSVSQMTQGLSLLTQIL